MNDVILFEQLALEFRRLLAAREWDRLRVVWGDMEEIKNRHGGMPPLDISVTRRGLLAGLKSSD